MRMLMLTAVLYIVTMPTHAYIGPGMGAGALAVALGVLGSIFLALFAVIYYPVKRMLKQRKTKNELRQRTAEQDGNRISVPGRMEVKHDSLAARRDQHRDCD